VIEIREKFGTATKKYRKGGFIQVIPDIRTGIRKIRRRRVKEKAMNY